MNEMHIRTGDTVEIISGKDRKKRGKVLEASPKEGKIIVEKRNMVTKHVKPRKMGQEGGIVKAEGPLYASKAMIVCPKCGKPTRVGYQVFGDGSKQRICKKCGGNL